MFANFSAPLWLKKLKSESEMRLVVPGRPLVLTVVLCCHLSELLGTEPWITATQSYFF